MNTQAMSIPMVETPADTNAKVSADKFLYIGVAAILLTIAGGLMSGALKGVAFAYLTAFTFWTGLTLGALFLIMIHHIFDASWSTVFRRQYEHAVSAFPYLFILFLPLLAVAFFSPETVWKWMDPAFDLSKVGGHGAVGDDILYVKKSGFLNFNFFALTSIFSFAIWVFLSSRFRFNSFSQDSDGDLKWTMANRVWAAGGLALGAVTLTLCIILWVKSLDYHWFSTMYGVWYFAGCIRAALSFGVIAAIWLWHRGDYKGILNNNHLHSIGMLMFAFTVFWAYVTFSQYFLIWNANIPEETFWYNLREINTDGHFNQWGYIGMFLLFGHFLLPFLVLIHYKVKISKLWMPRIAVFIAFVFLVDICYNVLPSKKDAMGNPYPLVDPSLVWLITSFIGIGSIWVWSYLKSFGTTKLIPIRDPRIVECLTYHE